MAEAAQAAGTPRRGGAPNRRRRAGRPRSEASPAARDLEALSRWSRRCAT